MYMYIYIYIYIFISGGFRGVHKGRMLLLNFEQQNFFKISIKR